MFVPAEHNNSVRRQQASWRTYFISQPPFALNCDYLLAKESLITFQFGSSDSSYVLTGKHMEQSPS